MSNFLDKLDRSLSFRGLFSLLLTLLMLFSLMSMDIPVRAADEDDEDDDTPIVVSMGDSYSAGEGIEDL